MRCLALVFAAAACSGIEDSRRTEVPPDRILRIADAIQPGGAREVSRDDPRGAWHFVTTYPEGTPGRVRRLLVDDAGVILERSHELELSAVPAAVLREAGGEVIRAEAVQGAPGEEWYRVTVRGADGSERVLDRR